MENNRKKMVFFVAGLCAGVILALASGFVSYKILKKHEHLVSKLERAVDKLSHIKFFKKHGKNIENFTEPVAVKNGRNFGKDKAFTFELYRGGTFVIDGKSGVALQKSDHYGDVAIIRSAKSLPQAFKITAVVGDIDYDLGKIAGIPNDPKYPEGPQNENGCYLLTIADEEPSGHHLNTWWHQHRKVVIDVDNNIWGSGMPNPIFMVYFDSKNKLVSFDGEINKWQGEWKKAISYQKKAWYKVEIEKTTAQFILSVYEQNGKLLKRGKVDLDDVWHGGSEYPDYFVIGDPHENYYQGSMKIESIAITY